MSSASPIPAAPIPAAPMSPPPPLEKLPVDSILIVSFGGPEGMDDVLPFLENVLRGKNVPQERMLEVVEHYRQFDGVSPINAQCRELILAVQEECKRRELNLPIYWGNRNWHPMLPDTVRQLVQDGRKRTIAFFTSMFSCYSGCRQYRENIAAAQLEVGDQAPCIEKVRKGFNHPDFIAAQKDCLEQALAQLPELVRAKTTVLFCAHSIPKSMADHSRYEEQLRESAKLICRAAKHGPWELVFQSRSGPPQQPWLEPDVCDRIEQLQAEQGIEHVVIQPLGFVSDHMEVLFDLDHEAAELCKEKGIHFIRAASVGVHPRFIKMIVDLIEERLSPDTERPCLGTYGPSHDLCPGDCCLYPQTGRRPG
jgi:ferrochelatase